MSKKLPLRHSLHIIKNGRELILTLVKVGVIRELMSLKLTTSLVSK